jgi:hypothetical protein
LKVHSVSMLEKSSIIVKSNITLGRGRYMHGAMCLKKTVSI